MHAYIATTGGSKSALIYEMSFARQVQRYYVYISQLIKYSLC
jgi:hypothetical protein